MGSEERGRDKDRMIARMGVPQMTPPVNKEYPVYYPVGKEEKRSRFSTPNDLSKFLPLIPIAIGFLVIFAGLSTYMTTAATPAPRGLDVMTFGIVVLMIGVVWSYLASRSSPAINATVSVGARPIQPSAQPQLPGTGIYSEEELRRGNPDQRR